METSAGAKRVKSFASGYHEYIEIWEPEIGPGAMLIDLSIGSILLV